VTFVGRSGIPFDVWNTSLCFRLRLDVDPDRLSLGAFVILPVTAVDGPADPDHIALEVDILPPEPKHLGSAHAGK
jgi:hypothetical protein